MSINLKRFNQQLENLLNDLIALFPDNKNIKVYREKYLLAKGMNPQLVLLIFLKYIYPYKQYIVDKNEEFFLSDNLISSVSSNSDIQKESDSDTDYILTQALGMKKLWQMMEDREKEIMWQYFKVLAVLCERYAQEAMTK